MTLIFLDLSKGRYIQFWEKINKLSEATGIYANAIFWKVQSTVEIIYLFGIVKYSVWRWFVLQGTERNSRREVREINVAELN